MTTTDNKLNQNDTVLVRFHKFDDVNMGWGDAGTVTYKRVPVNMFKEEENVRRDGTTFYQYLLEMETWKQLFPNHGQPWMGMGYDLVTDEFRKDEIEDIDKEMERLRNLREEIENV